MRCLACDAGLNEEQARKKMPISGEYWQLCGWCLRSIGVGRTVGVPDLENAAVQRDRLSEQADYLLRKEGMDRWGRTLAKEVDDGQGG